MQPFRENQVKGNPSLRYGSAGGWASGAQAERAHTGNISFSKEQIMAFVNAWITQEDWDNPAYRLHELAARHPRGFLQPNKKTSWVIDRERNVYLTHTAMTGDREDWREPGGYCELWTMLWKERFTEGRLTRNDTRTPQPNDSTSVVWSFWGIESSELPREEQSCIFPLLKEALIVYGFAGMSIQRPNTIVTFNF